MKTIKIILGVIIALTLVFFGTGLTVKETKYTTEVVINKPVAEVFANFENPEALKKWMPDVKSIEPINETQQKLGSTYKMVVDNQGQEMEMTEKIMAYVPNEKMTFQFITDGMQKTDDYNFIAEGNTTKVVQNSTVRASTFMLACTFPWFKGRFKKLSQNYMNQFKQFVEEKK